MQDARRYFDKCEKWNRGEPLPASTLRGVVDLLEYDQHMSKSITCPFDNFFNENKKMQGGEAEEPTKRSPRMQTPQNLHNPP